MGMSEFYGTPDEQEAIVTIHQALDLGVTFLDTTGHYQVKFPRVFLLGMKQS